MPQRLIDYSDTVKYLFDAIERIAFALDDQKFLDMVSEIVAILEKYSYKENK